MDSRNGRRRALVAAMLGVVGATLGVAGVGHVYLRAWRRAVAWFASVLGVGVVLAFVFADPTAATPSSLPPTVVVPYFLLLTVSIADAYALARRQVVGGETVGGDGATCPYCGRQQEKDLSLSFCWYCGESLSPEPDAESGAGDRPTSR